MKDFVSNSSQDWSVYFPFLGWAEATTKQTVVQSLAEFDKHSWSTWSLGIDHPARDRISLRNRSISYEFRGSECSRTTYCNYPERQLRPIDKEYEGFSHL
jgi:hypothetical protein